jgi:hypothetical protein
MRVMKGAAAVGLNGVPRELNSGDGRGAKLTLLPSAPARRKVGPGYLSSSSRIVYP